jgi:hypothetical protein
MAALRLIFWRFDYRVEHTIRYADKNVMLAFELMGFERRSGRDRHGEIRRAFLDSIDVKKIKEAQSAVARRAAQTRNRNKIAVLV